MNVNERVHNKYYCSKLRWHLETKQKIDRVLQMTKPIIIGKTKTMDSRNTCQSTFRSTPKQPLGKRVRNYTGRVAKGTHIHDRVNN
jgi:hypothetical protein